MRIPTDSFARTLAQQGEREISLQALRNPSVRIVLDLQENLVWIKFSNLIILSGSIGFLLYSEPSTLSCCAHITESLKKIHGGLVVGNF